MPRPPSTAAALAGAEILLNLSASNITIGKAEARRLLCASQSARCIAAYAYSAAGPGESTTDLAWDGHAAVFDTASRSPKQSVSRSIRLWPSPISISALLRQERMRVNTFSDCIRQNGEAADGISDRLSFDLNPRKVTSRCYAMSIAFRSCPPIQLNASGDLLRGLQHSGSGSSQTSEATLTGKGRHRRIRRP